MEPQSLSLRDSYRRAVEARAGRSPVVAERGAGRSPVEAWLEAFRRDPAGVWEGCVLGRRPIPGYARADLDETLSMVFGGLPSEDRALLDRTLGDWFEGAMGGSEARRREMGLSFHVHVLIETLSAVSLLELEGTRRRLFQG
ncbi:MAG: hypothetical protein HQL51_11410, partial [Magnetococcales bacterium]|nr:hypothetical protein [Magnetococcales bacterium]